MPGTPKKETLVAKRPAPLIDEQYDHAEGAKFGFSNHPRVESSSEGNERLVNVYDRQVVVSIE
jgi:hypothetical protein